MIIRDKEEDKSPTRAGSRPVERHRPAERHQMPKRPYRTNEDLRIVETAEERSKSADGRLSGIFIYTFHDTLFLSYPPASEASREVANLT